MAFNNKDNNCKLNKNQVIFNEAFELMVAGIIPACGMIFRTMGFFCGGQMRLPSAGLNVNMARHCVEASFQ